MAASPVSQAIRQLEAELGVELFVRTTRSVTLTEAGRRLLADGGAALQAVEEAFANATRAGHGVLGHAAARVHARRPPRDPPGARRRAARAPSGDRGRRVRGHHRQPLPRAAQPPARRRGRLLHRARPRARAPDAAARAPLRADALLAPARGRGGDLAGRAARGPLRGAARRISTRASTGACGSLCGFEPPCVVASLIWDDAEWPPGRRPGRARPRGVARHAAPHMRAVPLVPGGAHADRARVARGRRVARPAPLPRGRYAVAGTGSRIVKAGSSTCSSGPIESA